MYTVFQYGVLTISATGGSQKALGAVVPCFPFPYLLRRLCRAVMVLGTGGNVRERKTSASGDTHVHVDNMDVYTSSVI